jgi:hypothetical protein
MSLIETEHTLAAAISPINIDNQCGTYWIHVHSFEGRALSLFVTAFTVNTDRSIAVRSNA